MALTKIPSSLLDTSGGFDLQGNITLGDNEKIILGDSSDLQIYHNSSNSYIDDAGTGALNLRSSGIYLEKANGAEVMISAIADGAVTLYHDGSIKLATSSAGISINEGKLTISEVTGSDAYTQIRKTNTGSNLALVSQESIYMMLDENDDQTNRSFQVKKNSGAPGAGAVLFVVEESGNSTVYGNLAVTGDLNITGDVNSVSVTDLDVTDKTITLGKGQTESASGGSGIIIDGSSASILWDETNGEWDFNNPLSIVNSIGGDTVLNLAGTYGAGNNVALLGFARSGGAVAGDIRYLDATTEMEIGTSTAHAFSLKTSGTRRLYVASGGNVGIGNTSPSATLEVGTLTSGQTGTMKINNEGGNTATLEVLSRTNRSILKVADNDTAGYISAENGLFSIGRNTGNNSANININSSNYVGIGTNAPTKTLSIKAPSGSNGGIDVFHNNGNKVAELVHSGSGDEGRLSLLDSGSTTVQFMGETGQNSYINSGKLIIGDTASHTNDLFQIETPASGGGHGIQIRRNDSNNDQVIGHIQFGNNTDTDLAKIQATTDGSTDNARISFWTQADGGSITERMRIAHDGHFMFNTTANAGFKYFIINQVNDGALIFRYNNTDKWQQSLDSSSYDKMFYSYTAGRHVMKMHADGRDFDFTSDTANDYTPRLNLYSKSTGAYAGEINFYSKHNSNEWVCASIFATGASGYGTGNPPSGGMRLYVRGAYGDTHALNAVDISANGTVSGDFNDTSDVALKKDIVSLNASDSLTAIKALNPVSFKWKLDDEKRSGFIAQEVEKHLPDDVIGEDWRAEVKGQEGDPSSRDEGSKGKAVNSTGILAHAVKVIQEQQKEIDALKARVSTLEG